MSRPILLSAEGSDRGTGYDLSNKLIRRGDRLILGWLNAPRESGAPARVMLGAADPGSGALEGAVCLATGIDNHCGPALAQAPDGTLHFMAGAHAGEFLHRWTDSSHALDPAVWSDPVSIGPRATYPSLICDPEGVLHLTYRSSQAPRWRLLYRRKPPDREWSDPVTLAQSPSGGYCHWMQSLAADSQGCLHLLFQFHFSESGNARDCLTYAAVHLRSRDGGLTWQDARDAVLAEPVTFESATPFCTAPQGGMRINSLALDREDVPWVFAVHPDAAGGLLYALPESGPRAMSPGPATEPFDMSGGRSLSMAFDAAGELQLLFAQHPEGRATEWFDPAQELHHARLRVEQPQRSAPARRLTGPDPAAAHWLPVFEWGHPQPAGQAAPEELWYMWTEGLNLGGIGGDNANAMKTRIWLNKLQSVPAA